MMTFLGYVLAIVVAILVGIGITAYGGLFYLGLTTLLNAFGGNWTPIIWIIVVIAIVYAVIVAVKLIGEAD